MTRNAVYTYRQNLGHEPMLTVVLVNQLQAYAGYVGEYHPENLMH